MLINEMHVYFRQYAQQMGMQNYRAILPEQIDTLINTSISDVTNQLIRDNISLTKDRIVTDSSKIGQINALRTLYKVELLDFDSPTIAQINDGSNSGLFRIDYLMKTNIEDNDEEPDAKIDALYLVNLSISYHKGTTESENLTTYYPVRFIDDMYLADTMQDFTLKPRVRTPIAVYYNNTLDVYLGENYTTANGKLKSTELHPKYLRVSYLSRPNKVKYVSDVGGKDEHCNLPENMHIDIIKHAVDLYNLAVSGRPYNEVRQQPQQEVNRNQ